MKNFKISKKLLLAIFSFVFVLGCSSTDENLNTNREVSVEKADKKDGKIEASNKYNQIYDRSGVRF